MSDPDRLQTPAELQRQSEISQITQNDRNAFHQWIQTSQGDTARLDMPVAALRYMVIPPRVLELAENPHAVDVLVLEGDQNSVSLYTLEHKNHPVSDRDALIKCWNDYDSIFECFDGEYENVLRTFRNRPPPENVDMFHIEAKELIKEGKLTINDFIVFHLVISLQNEQQLVVDEYKDNVSIRRQGIGSSFYSRFRETIKSMGIRFITGKNSEKNISFFTQVLGRCLLSQVKPEFRSVLFANFDNEDHKLCTIDFLYPEDKAKYLVS